MNLEQKLVNIAKYVIIVGIIIFLLGWGIRLIITHERNDPSYFSNPKNWIVEEPTYSRVDVPAASGQRATYDNERGIISYHDGRVFTAFQSYGLYKGIFFGTYAVDEGVAIVEIGPNMDPTNGIMEIFIMEKFEGETPWIYIFVDQEWVTAMPETQIVWGPNYEQELTARFIPLKDGIFYFKIEDQTDRFIPPADGGVWQQKGGVLVGNITRAEWFSNALLDKLVIHFG